MGVFNRIRRALGLGRRKLSLPELASLLATNPRFEELLKPRLTIEQEMALIERDRTAVEAVLQRNEAA